MALVKPVRSSKIVGLLKSSTEKKKTNAKRGFGEKKTLERTDWLKTALNLAIEAGQELWNEPSHYFRVSGIGDPCIRSMVLGALGHNVPHAAKTLRIFRVGTLIGEVIADTLLKRGILLEAEGEVLLEDPPIKGHFDAYIKGEGECEDEEFLVEVKSMNDYSFDKLPEEHSFLIASHSPLFLPYVNYVTQWNTYSGLKNKVKGCFLFESKNTQRHKVYWMEFDQELFDSTIAKANEAAPYLKAERIPPIPLDRNPYGPDRVCSNCPRKYLCEILPRDGCSLEEAKHIDKQVRG